MNQQPKNTRDSRIGVVWTPREPFFNTQATRDTIRHFANGIGDRNPLYRDRDYAQKTRYGRLTAPGCFLHSVYPTYAGGGGEGRQESSRERTRGGAGGFGGTDWQWLLPILEGDEFTYTNTYLGAEEKESGDGGRLRITTGLAEYKNQRGQVVARGKGWNVGVIRGEASRGQIRERDARDKAKYSKEELQKIYDDYDKEIIRGATPRYWEDVQVGDELGHVLKGPLSVRDVIVWAMGGGSPYLKAHGLDFDWKRRHPGLDRLVPATGEWENPELWHYLDTVAQAMGVIRAIDYGVQRISWLGNLLTNWVGDDGFVTRMRAELRRHNPVGDTCWCKGKVSGKYLDENGEPCVDIDCWGENQRGEIILRGQAMAILPSRDKGTSPLDTRLPK